MQYHGQKWADSSESIYIAHNTVLIYPWSRYHFAATMSGFQMENSARRIFNNMFIYLGDYPAYFISKSLEGMDFQMDGNLHWSTTEAAPEDYLKLFRESEYSQGKWEANSVVADPKLKAVDATIDAVHDYRPQPGSPAIGAATALSSDAPEAVAQSAGKTIGAYEAGDEPLRVGVDGRITAGEPID
jgi:hypothetical protein